MKHLIDAFVSAMRRTSANGGRHWPYRETCRYSLHPSVEACFSAHLPKDWHALLLEWPHISQSDPTRLSYTRSDEHGQADRQTVTGISKYLTRHWPALKPHTIEKFTNAYSVDHFTIETTLPEMILALEQGPWSCMQAAYGNMEHFDLDVLYEWAADRSKPEPDWESHFYSVYDPSLGWALAVRRNAGEVLGRALVNGKTFVRTYAAAGSKSNCPDLALTSWLEAQGYAQRDGWRNGTNLLRLDHPTRDGSIFPYIDGDNQQVEVYRGTLVITPDGDRMCNCTDGQSDDVEDDSIGECEDCGFTIHEGDEYLSAGRHQDHLTCCTGHYVEVRGSSRYSRYPTSYWLREGDAAEVAGRGWFIDPESPPDDVVELAGGDWALDCDAVYVDGDYYLESDPDIVPLAEPCPSTEDSYAFRSEAWEDVHGLWHSNHVEKVELDGEFYTEDEADAIINKNQLTLEGVEA